MNLPHPATYAEAQPFPHCVVDGAIGPDYAASLADEFPDPADDRWVRFDLDEERKLQGDDPSLWGPHTQHELRQLQAPDFVRRIETLTGLGPLLPSTLGGGLHLIEHGGFLKVHSDFNRSPGGLYRAVNLLLFLTDNGDDWTAELDLTGERGFDGHADDRAIRCIAPKPGRCVIFSTSHDSFHGHPEPLRSHERKSLAVYYFTEHPPPGYEHDQGTTWL